MDVVDLQPVHRLAIAKTAHRSGQSEREDHRTRLVEPGERTVKLTIPRGSQFPLDFVETSNGLLRTGSVIAQDDGRIQLQLDLAQGAVERIDYRPDGLTVRIGRRLVALDLNARATDNYLLGPDDTIKLTVHNQEQLSAELTVTREGTIFPPLVGETRVEGMTPRDVAILAYSNSHAASIGDACAGRGIPALVVRPGLLSSREGALMLAGLRLVAEIPGFTTEELDLRLEGRQLSLTATKDQEGSNSDLCLRRELVLPIAVDPGGLTARLEAGVLTVFFPRAAEAAPVSIPVSSH